jgi:hypothetical protein
MVIKALWGDIGTATEESKKFGSINRKCRREYLAQKSTWSGVRYKMVNTNILGVSHPNRGMVIELIGKYERGEIRNVNIK